MKFGFVDRLVAEHCEGGVTSASDEDDEDQIVAFLLDDFAVSPGARDRVAQRSATS